MLSADSPPPRLHMLLRHWGGLVLLLHMIACGNGGYVAHRVGPSLLYRRRCPRAVKSGAKNGDDLCTINHLWGVNIGMCVVLVPVGMRV